MKQRDVYRAYEYRIIDTYTAGASAEWLSVKHTGVHLAFLISFQKLIGIPLNRYFSLMTINDSFLSEIETHVDVDSTLPTYKTEKCVKFIVTIKLL